MTSQAQKNSGYPLPEVLTGHELLCVYMLIPDVDEYRAAFLGQIYGLQNWWNWEKSYQPGDTRASQAAFYWRDLIYDHLCITYGKHYNPNKNRKLPSGFILTPQNTMSNTIPATESDLAPDYLDKKLTAGDNIEIEVESVGLYRRLKVNAVVPPQLDPFSVGDYKTSAQTVSHGKWLICEGDFVSKTTYPELFDVLGYVFGSDPDPDLFKLPDYRGRTAIGVGHGDMLTPRALGDYDGAERITLSSGEMPIHSHQQRSSSGVNLLTANGATSSTIGQNADVITRNVASPVPLKTAEEGGSLSHANMQPSIAIGSLFIYSGVEV